MLAFVQLLAACGGEVPAGSESCSDALPAECAIGSETCLDDWFDAVRCLRGDAAQTRPSVDFVSDPEALALLARGAPGLTPDETRARSRALQALSLLGASTDHAAPASLAGYHALYLHDLREIVVLDAITSLSRRDQLLVLAHEFVHALQDHERPLEQRFAAAADDFDRRLGLNAQLEGEATYYERVLGRRLDGADASAEAIESESRGKVEIANRTARRSAELADEGPALFAYAYGLFAAAHALSEADGPGRFDGLKTSRGIMLPEETPNATALVLEAPPAESRLVLRDSLGAWITALHVVRAEESPDDLSARVEELALAYVADQLAVYEAVDGSWSLRWQLRFANESSARAFVERPFTGTSEARLRYETSSRGPDSLVVVSGDAD